jgi:hypothetical protein
LVEGPAGSRLQAEHCGCGGGRARFAGGTCRRARRRVVAGLGCGCYMPRHEIMTQHAGAHTKPASGPGGWGSPEARPADFRRRREGQPKLAEIEDTSGVFEGRRRYASRAAAKDRTAQKRPCREQYSGANGRSAPHGPIKNFRPATSGGRKRQWGIKTSGGVLCVKCAAHSIAPCPEHGHGGKASGCGCAAARRRVVATSVARKSVWIGYGLVGIFPTNFRKMNKIHNC